MSGSGCPIQYDHIAPLAFGGTLPESATFDTAKAVILPVPLESTTSYVPGTRNGPREILVASTHLELWDEETGTDVHPIGIYTLPEMELPFDDMGDIMAEIRRVTSAILEHDKFPIVLGGEHSITSPVVAAVAAKHPGVSVLQIDARGARAGDQDLLRHQYAAGQQLDRRGRRIAGRHGLHHDRRRWNGSRDYAGDRHAGARRVELVRTARALAGCHLGAHGGGLRYRRAVAAAGRRGAELPLRETALQDPDLQVLEKEWYVVSGFSRTTV
jgi:hypothetical protein